MALALVLASSHPAFLAWLPADRTNQASREYHPARSFLAPHHCPSDLSYNRGHLLYQA